MTRLVQGYTVRCTGVIITVVVFPWAACFGADAAGSAERHRMDVIARASKSVVCVLTPDRSSGGSGVIISQDGYGITNFHVVAPLLPSKRGLGGLSDGRTCPLQVLGVDPTGDLAMFRLGGDERFTPAVPGDSDTVNVGDEVIALGNPFMLAEDYSPTATFGIISGLHRYQYGSDARSLVYTDCIQIDASINPGNSGGPLFDLDGRLIGINGRASFKNQDLLKRRINVGVAYAISINQVKRFIPALREGWLVEHGTLGATVRDGAGGVVFDQMLRPSAAAGAGVEIGDELLALDNRPITTANGFANAIGVYPAGWPVSLRFRHGGQELVRQVNLDPLAVRSELPFKKADPAWIRQSAASQPATASQPADRSVLFPTLQAGVARIYGGRLGDQRGYATGVNVSADGEVVTTLSLLLEADDLRVVTSDGRLHTARVVFRDPVRHLALLRVRDIEAASVAEKQDEPHAAIAVDAAATAEIGDTVYVVGNPFKIAEGDEACSVSRGIISGRVRLDARPPGAGEPCAYRGEVLIMDAMASNPGSPGSAVFDANGRWIGLVGEVLESRLTNTLLNYALPMSEVDAFLRDARSQGQGSQNGSSRTVSKAPGFHGIRLSRIGYRAKLPFIDAVAKGSPAERAGLLPGDLVLSVNGTSTPRSSAFDEACARLRVGDEMALVIKRGDQITTPRFNLEEPPK